MLIKSPFHTRVLFPPNSREGNHFPRERSPFENINKRNRTRSVLQFIARWLFSLQLYKHLCVVRSEEELSFSIWKFWNTFDFQRPFWPAGESFCGWKFLKVISNVCYWFNFQGSFWPAGEWFSCQWYSAVTVFHPTTTSHLSRCCSR